ncbi:MAG: hypothetical protein RBS88_03300 [Spongiibacteraceae bacterium]|jgi:hypothetical protein|nr:hypothetical protein [Spongiibacteraceae bacterium]
MSTAAPHRWQFFRAGGFEQAQINTPADLAFLRSLDRKLWASLACPVTNLQLDRRMLGYIDSNGDGRIRAPELLDAIDWTLTRLGNPAVLFQPGPLPLPAIVAGSEGDKLRCAAARLLKVLGKPEADSVECSDTDDLATLFPPAEPNGDGLVPAAMTSDPELQAAIADIIKALGAQTDRSGEAAISADQINAAFDQAEAVLSWHQQGSAAGIAPFGEATAAAVAAVEAVRAKVDDYFTRVAMARFDARAATLMNASEEELLRLASLSLADPAELAGLPLASIAHGDALPLGEGLNPACAAAMAKLHQQVLMPLFGTIDSLTQAQWQSVLQQCDAYVGWLQQKPASAVATALPLERVLELAGSDLRERLLALVAEDLAAAEASDGLVDLDKLIRFHHGLVTLVRNFVSFQNFYGRQEKAIFQAGTLYIDGRSCDLVVEVGDVDAHATVAANSESFLLYCRCTRIGQPVNGRETMQIVAAITNGDEGDLMVGRNGLFYDRDGNDWDATVVKVIQNAVSVREAFWSPYRRVAGMISEQIQKFAANRDAEMVSKTAEQVRANGAAAAPAPFDIARFAGIFAAIGLAVGALGTALAAIFSGLLTLAWWQLPLVIVGVILAISGPSMLLAWFKLRRRSLGPILDANGWAVNTQARISIAFGEVLTQLAKLPPGSARALHDPYARKRPGWVYVLVVIAVVTLAVLAWRCWPNLVAALQLPATQ